jgi:hypothetical protein
MPIGTELLAPQSIPLTFAGVPLCSVVTPGIRARMDIRVYRYRGKSSSKLPVGINLV